MCPFLLLVHFWRLFSHLFRRYCILNWMCSVPCGQSQAIRLVRVQVCFVRLQSDLFMVSHRHLELNVLGALCPFLQNSDRLNKFPLSNCLWHTHGTVVYVSWMVYKVLGLTLLGHLFFAFFHIYYLFIFFWLGKAIKPQKLVNNLKNGHLCMK